MPPLVRYFGFSVLLTAAGLVFAVVYGGVAGLIAIAVLSVLEVCLSFDNAVVNAKVLKGMSPFWRKMFLYVGIFIAVFGVRLVLPILLVSITTGLSFTGVFDLALSDAEAYGAYVEDAAPAIFAFGGTFLLLVFLNFMLDTDEEKEHHWLGLLERPLAKVGTLPGAATVLSAAYVIAAAELASPDKRETVLFSGLAGIVVYYAVQMLSAALDGKKPGAVEDAEGEIAEETRQPTLSSDEDGRTVTNAATGRTTVTNTATKTVAAAGLGAFLYLEVLDASFSFDGVIGAFAISNDIFVIMVGLAIGAFWVRSLTIFMVDKGTLDAYRYLEHGAMWAIGFLAAIMLAEQAFHVSEYITGLTGVVFIIAAAITSVVVTRREAAEAGDDPHQGRHTADRKTLSTR